WPDGSRALEDVTLDVEAGTTLAILGSSGAGKSTLLRLVAGFERPDEGTIRLGTETLAGDGVCLAPELRGVGMVFQALELWSHMTVAERSACPVDRVDDAPHPIPRYRTSRRRWGCRPLCSSADPRR
ncbi:MAG: ATP-binding cassette domain-containing protein, partial [Planctomycetota bacterium]|nr:ATP-binding cassette domain-containing protein [Planctomycetota bacterium]